MKAAVIHAPGKVTCDNVDDPTIQQQDDVILKVTATAICGSDLHIYSGGIPQPRPMVLGHEFMGIVEEVGKGVTKLKVGDRVVVPFPIACGSCYFCNHELPGHCENSNPDNYGPEGAVLTEKGGALFGYTDLYGGIDGGQAQYVRVPYANFGPRIVPEGLTDEQVLFLTDIFPTGYTGIDWGEVKGGQAPTHKHIDKLMGYVADGKVTLNDVITHRLPLSKISHAYDIFKNKEDGCVKVVLDPWG